MNSQLRNEIFQIIDDLLDKGRSYYISEYCATCGSRNECGIVRKEIEIHTWLMSVLFTRLSESLSKEADISTTMSRDMLLSRVKLNALSKDVIRVIEEMYGSG